MRQLRYKLLSYLQDGKNVGLVSDRGTPVISDPGYKTVKYISDKGYNVVALPGACAFVPALIASGISPQPFTFYGFLDSKLEKKRKELENLNVKRRYSVGQFDGPLDLLWTLIRDNKINIYAYLFICFLLIRFKDTIFLPIGQNEITLFYQLRPQLAFLYRNIVVPTCGSPHLSRYGWHRANGRRPRRPVRLSPHIPRHPRARTGLRTNGTCRPTCSSVPSPALPEEPSHCTSGPSPCRSHR